MAYREKTESKGCVASPDSGGNCNEDEKDESQNNLSDPDCKCPLGKGDNVDSIVDRHIDEMIGSQDVGYHRNREGKGYLRREIGRGGNKGMKAGV
jgi:hypothetical protein